MKILIPLRMMSVGSLCCSAGVSHVSIESGDTHTTVWDPEYTESGAVPGGCIKGAVKIERRGAFMYIR